MVRMTPRRTAVVVLSAALMALVACSSTTSGQGSPRGSAGPSGSAGTSATGKSAPTDANGLAALMRSGLASITSTHLALDVTAAAQHVQGAGDEELRNAKLVAFDLAETIGQLGTVRMRIVDGKTYVGLPAGVNHSGKPWVLVTATSTDPVIKSLNSVISNAQNAASLDTASTFVKSAKSVKLVGAEPVNGAPANHYSLVVDIAKLPSTYPGRQALIAAGLSTLPVELWIDSKGRPVKIVDKVTIQGQAVSSLVTLSRFNEPVHITAPPADQVSTS
jgi:hypothetical protein